jgi:hypothetical protein
MEAAGDQRPRAAGGPRPAAGAAQAAAGKAGANFRDARLLT